MAKPTQYKKLYKEIWDERKEICLMSGGEYVKCTECPKRIYLAELNVWHFAHVKSKGSDPANKYNKNNIVIKCAECHGNEHASGKFNNYTGIK